MLNARVFWLAAVLSGAGVSRIVGADAWIHLGNERVHPTRVLAKFKPGTPVGLSRELARQTKSSILRQYSLVPGLAVLEERAGAIPAGAEQTEEAKRERLLDRLQALKSSGLFEYVQPDYVHEVLATPTDEAFVDGRLWGLLNTGQNGGKPGADIGVTNAWDFSTGSTNVVVAVIDTGIRYTHQDLATQMWRNPGEIAGNGVDDDSNGYVDDVFGINAITGTGDPFDDHNHGTHVAGTIGAAANNGKPHVGVVWQVRLMGLKFLSSQGFGFTSDAITCIDYAVDKGVPISNNSWGGGPFEQALFDSIDRARERGMLFVAAAGNSANNNDLNPAYPASYPLDNIVSVAALDSNDRLADFSNYGQAAVHLGAPGVDIYSSTAGSDSDYQTISGTSMASPHVAGIAALLLSQYPGSDVEELKGRLLAGVVPVAALAGRAITGGRVNAYNALTATGTGVLQLSVNPPSGSAILRGSAQPVFVKVKDLFGVTNATVTASVSGGGRLTFLNDGQPPDQVGADATYSATLQAPQAVGQMALTIVATAPGKVGSTNTIYYSVAPPPPNDDFANATKVPFAGASYSSNNRFASLETNEPRHAASTNAAASLWWVWSPAQDGPVLMDATGSSINAVLAVYTGSSLTDLQPVASSVGSLTQKRPAHVTFEAKAAVAYAIAVASASTNSLGSIRLRVAPGGRLDNNPPSVFIANPPSGTSVSTRILSLEGTAFDAPPDASGVTEVLVRVNDGIASPANGTTNWTSAVALRPGRNVIQAQAIDAAGKVSGTAAIEVSYLPSGVANDLFANAAVLAGDSDSKTVDTTVATKEVGEPQLIAGNAGGKSVWFTFVPAADGVVTITTTNSNFDTVMALYGKGNPAAPSRVTNLVEVVSNDDALEGVTFSKISQAVRANQPYWVAVDGFNGAGGILRLSYSFAPASVSRLTVSATTGGAVSPPSGDYPSGSTVALAATAETNYEFVGWEGDLVSSANPLRVVVDRDLILTARFRARQFTDGFESGGFGALRWTTGGNRPWTVQSESASFGSFAARSGAITHGQTSSLSLVHSTAAGVASFDFRVSSEANWDFLEFYLNGVLLRRWSGEAGWATFRFSVPAGLNRLEWRYMKDALGSAGLDAAFIDNLDLPVVPTVMRLFNPTRAGFKLQFQGEDGRTVRIQASRNLVAWQDIATRLVNNGDVIDFVDPDAPNHPVRFYRAVAP